MADVQADLITVALDTTSARKSRLQKAFSELKDCKAIIANFTLTWEELEEHFAGVEKLWKERVDELREKEEAFEAKAKEQQQLLDKREEAISWREKASLARIQEQKDQAITTISEERRRCNAEKQASKIEDAEEKQFQQASKIEDAEEKQFQQASKIDGAAEKRVQQSSKIKDAEEKQVQQASKIEDADEKQVQQASKIENTEEKRVRQSSKIEDAEEKQVPRAERNEASVSAGETFSSQDGASKTLINDVEGTLAVANGCATPSEAVNEDSPQVASGSIVRADEVESSKISEKDEGSSPVKAAVPEMKVRKQLKTLCENMDSEGVRNYLVEHRKHMGAIRFELPPALQFAIDPAQLVLHALEGYPTEHGDCQTVEKEVGASALRRSCILLLEGLASVLVDPLLGENYIVVSPKIRDSAKEIALNWKSKMEFQPDPSTGTSLDAQAFLQLLATFGIASEFDTDELCKLVMIIANRKHLPALCKSLGLAAQIPDILMKLSKEGKAVEALALSHSFGMMDKIEPVPLLKAYLKEARKTAQSIAKNGNNSPAAQTDSTMKELAALKAVLKCIEEYKLEAQYSPVPLQRSLAQLEKAKFDRKRAAVAVKAKAKRPRGTVTTGGSGICTSSSERGLLKPSDRGQLTGVGLSSYGLPSQSSYDRWLPANYAATYVRGVRSPVNLSNSYLYTDDGLGSQVYGSSAYSNPSATYGSYQFRSRLPTPPLAYQSSFLH